MAKLLNPSIQVLGLDPKVAVTVPAVLLQKNDALPSNRPKYFVFNYTAQLLKSILR
jgi:hypothetical protein